MAGVTRQAVTTGVKAGNITVDELGSVMLKAAPTVAYLNKAREKKRHGQSRPKAPKTETQVFYDPENALDAQVAATEAWKASLLSGVLTLGLGAVVTEGQFDQVVTMASQDGQDASEEIIDERLESFVGCMPFEVFEATFAPFWEAEVRATTRIREAFLKAVDQVKEGGSEAVARETLEARTIEVLMAVPVPRLGAQ